MTKQFSVLSKPQTAIGLQRKKKTKNQNPKTGSSLQGWCFARYSAVSLRGCNCRRLVDGQANSETIKKISENIHSPRKVRFQPA